MFSAACEKTNFWTQSIYCQAFGWINHQTSAAIPHFSFCYPYSFLIIINIPSKSKPRRNTLKKNQNVLSYLFQSGCNNFLILKFLQLSFVCFVIPSPHHQQWRFLLVEFGKNTTLSFFWLRWFFSLDPVVISSLPKAVVPSCGHLVRYRF